MLDDFYKDSEIFITGASGVVGKGLVEKLLRSCKVKRIFVLLRPRKNDCPQKRLKNMLDEKIFRKLREKQEHELSKVQCIEGDITLPMLGISAENRQLMENVSIVFHCAATVRFDEPLMTAIALNVGGTHETLKIAQGLRKLQLFLHVSTSYSNPYLQYMRAKMYPSPMDWRTALKMLDSQVAEDQLDIVTKRMIEGFPNTYTFTKNLSESLVNDYRSQLPVTIFRPSIIISCAREPEPGFPTAPIGAMGLIALLMCGIQKVLHAKNVFLDFIPLDLVVKTCLYFSIKAAQLYSQNGKPATTPIYVSSFYGLTEYRAKELGPIFEHQAKQYPAIKSLFAPGMVFTSSRIVYLAKFFLMHILPAVVVDTLLLVFGQKPALMKIMRKTYATGETLAPFIFNDFPNESITNLQETLDEVRGTVYDINEDVYCGRGVQTNDFSVNCAYKVREVILNEDPSTLPLARKILQVKLMISIALQLWLLKVIGSFLSRHLYEFYLAVSV